MKFFKILSALMFLSLLVSIPAKAQVVKYDLPSIQIVTLKAFESGEKCQGTYSEQGSDIELPFTVTCTYTTGENMWRFLTHAYQTGSNVAVKYTVSGSIKNFVEVQLPKQ